MGDWFSSMIRSFFFTIDHVIYGAIEKVYDLFETISRTTILEQSQIAQVADRIYDLLAIFMIFKVTLSLITYVVSPDSFNDKSSGIGSLVRNVVLVLALLVLTPYLFNYAFQLQGLILKDNIIPKLIFGDEQVSEDVYNAGENLTFITMSAFYYPDASVIPGCSELTDADGGAISQSCYDALGKAADAASEAGEDSFTTTDVENYKKGFEHKSYGLTFRKSLVTAKTADDQYVIDYSYFLSTAVGIVILLIIISFCMDVAVRSIKLSFLQLVAPIPIISFIDPKGGKDGMFKKWYKMCFGTYLSLFIRLFVIYFAIYIIKLVGDANMYDVVSGATVTGLWLKVFIIIGALMFAKQLPKILESLGIKLDSNFQLNPLKKVSDQALGGKTLTKFAKGAAATAGAAGLAGAVNFGTRALNKKTWEKGISAGIAKTATSTLGGIAGAGYRGLTKTAKGDKMGKIFTDSYGEAMFAKIQREDLNRKGSTIWGRAKADVKRHMGVLNDAQTQTLDLAHLDEENRRNKEVIAKSKEKLKEAKNNMALEKQTKIRVHSDKQQSFAYIKSRIDSFKGPEGINVKDVDAQIEAMKQQGEYYVKLGEKFTIKDENGKMIIKEATAEDVAAMRVSDKGAALDKRLDEEREKAYTYLIKNDAAVQQHEKILVDNGATPAELESYGSVKKASFDEQHEIEKINAEYYAQEQAFEMQEKELTKQEARVQEEYEAEIKKRNLDKNSAHWKANEADNASRWVKSPQPEGWMPTADVDERNYTVDPALNNFYDNTFVSTQEIQSRGMGGPRGPIGK